MQHITRKAIILIILVSLALLVFVPQALAATGYRIEGDANGLTIEALPKNQGIGNLAPGDVKESRLKLTNTNDSEVRVWIRTNITARRPGPNGGDLAEVLHLLIRNVDVDENGTVMNVNATITNDTFDNAANEGNVFIGTMDPGEEIYLDFTVTLPGPDTGNEYQGSSIDANWTFITESPEVPGGGGGGGGGRPPGGPGGTPGDTPGEEPPIEIPEEPVPGGPTDIPPEGDVPGTPDDLIIIEEEPVPGGPAKMPKTGEIPPVYFYGIGSLAVLLGVAVRKRKK